MRRAETESRRSSTSLTTVMYDLRADERVDLHRVAAQPLPDAARG
ncbi:hypothetical protein ACIF85_32545 [Streptomyces sp. NPDC086033]